jgi:hypothetical protein
MEFGVSPMPESRREMIDRGRLFEAPPTGGFPRRAASRYSPSFVKPPSTDVLRR